MNECDAFHCFAASHNRHYTRNGHDYQGLFQAQSFGTRKSVVSLASGVPGAGFQS